jgi:tryptophan-rich sensory protein
MSTIRQALGLALSVAICFAAAGVGSLFTRPAIEGWYAALQKPSWTPPNWVFGPVWTVLYLAMATAAWLVWRRAGFAGARLPLTLFALQLVLNLAWTGVFFGLRMPGAAFAEIVLLWLFILVTAIAFWPISRVAAWLMVPYLGWVTYAATLNYGIWRLNA